MQMTEGRDASTEMSAATEGQPVASDATALLSAVAIDVRGGRSTVGWRAGKVSHPRSWPRLLA